ncbi:MFS transporter [Georgenia muralis]|uniref:CP family cyanate transporter-like MFS transporter n=1 Tax=Georgenia muralis TaxID=154117 RepID=A0A3N4ZYH7_9MICO|nr:MFS transporter [Georgenia muralis]RPF26125.1 CP family cyanate transporter-like MFS transporter [Georgenia muralis]
MSRTNRPLGPAILLAGIVLVAVNMRPVITAVGPVLPQVGEDVGLGAAALGTLGAVPVLAFAVVSPLVHPLLRRFGLERTVLAALLVLGLGTVLRSLPGPAANLWVGTAVIGATVAVGNVALPVAVKRDFPLQVPRTTGTYVATQTVFAALASGLAVPLAGLGTWRLSLGIWVVAITAAVALWLPRLRRGTSDARTDAAREDGRAPAGSAGEPADGPADGAARRAAPGAAGIGSDVQRHRSVWRAPLAWQVAAYMGLQSTPFYVLITWLPSIEQDLGIGAAEAGWHLFGYLAAAIVANLLAPSLMRVGEDQRFAAVAVAALMVVATLGVTLWPGGIVLWVVLMGLSSGAALVVTLSLVGLRSYDHRTASQLSAMSQSLGYALAGSALVLAGLLRDATGPGPLLLVCLAGVALAQLALGVLVGRHQVLLSD